MGALRFGDPPHRVREVLGDPDVVEDPDISGLLSWYYRRWALKAKFWNENPPTEPGNENTLLHAIWVNDGYVTFNGKPIVGMSIAQATAVLREAGLEPDGEPVDLGSGELFQFFAGGVTLSYDFHSVGILEWERVKSDGGER